MMTLEPLRAGESIDEEVLGARGVTDLTSSPFSPRRVSRSNSLLLFNDLDNEPPISPLPLTRVLGAGEFGAIPSAFLEPFPRQINSPPPPFLSGEDFDQLISLDTSQQDPPTIPGSRKRSAFGEESAAKKRVQEVIELDESSVSEDASAAIPRVPEVTHENYQSRIKDNIVCSICKDILHNPACLVPCSHLLCGGCFVQLKKSAASVSGNGVSCPECRKKVTMIIDAPPALRSVIADYLDLHPDEKRSDMALREMDELDKSIVRGVPLSLSSARAARASTAWIGHPSNRRAAQSNQPPLYSPYSAAGSMPSRGDYPLFYTPPFDMPPDVLAEFAELHSSSSSSAMPTSSSAHHSQHRLHRLRALSSGMDFEQAVTAFSEATMCSRSVAVARVEEANRFGVDLNFAIAHYLDSVATSSVAPFLPAPASSSSAAPWRIRRTEAQAAPQLPSDTISLQ